MRRLDAVSLSLVALAVFAARATAQNPPAAETFITADGVKLHGLFHASPRGAKQNNAVIVLLYQPGFGNRLLANTRWSGLANRLVQDGFHVFEFDWRGHGQSTTLADPQTFWNNPFTGLWNARHVKGANEKPFKSTIQFTDFEKPYFPMYALDLAAVRQHLDAKNDLRIVSTSSIYLIGEGDTAALGMLWMAAEWLRPAVHPNANQLGGAPRYLVVPQPLLGGLGIEAGNDIAGAVWLSASVPAAIQTDDITRWSKNAPKLRTNNTMLFMHGGQDTKAKIDGKAYYDQVLVAKGSKTLGVAPLEQTFLYEIKGTKLNGVNLLDENSLTEETILKYLSARQRDRVAIGWKLRNYMNSYYINLSAFGLMPGPPLIPQTPLEIPSDVPPALPSVSARECDPPSGIAVSAPPCRRCGLLRLLGRGRCPRP